ncbi:MAG TPA: tetratricopeptide repeat protein, partial [Anaeromyxobacteraceae bacterium]|nr:tetratricopeptide repeat protein [Anaeromyxobacteraceae bacterium]
PPKAPGVPAALARLLARGLSLDPAARPRDGQEWLDGLLAVQARTSGRPRRALLRAGAVAATAMAAAAVLLALRSGWPGRGEEAGPPVTVAVADVENATSEPELAGLSGLLITSLEQSRRLSVLTRSRMLDLLAQAGHDRVDRIDERLGRDVSRRAGARALLLATIRRFDEVYAIELKAIDPVADAYLFTLKEQGNGKASIPSLIDRLGEATRRALREQASEVETSRVELASVVTPSLEAYRHYFLGVQCIDSLALVAGCIEHFRRALQVDPTFAMAHYMVAYTAEFRQAGPGEQKAAIAAAIANIDRAPPKERGLILAWNAHLEGKDDEAAGIHRQLVERYPEDAQVAYVAGDLLFHREDCTGALPQFDRALALGSAVPVLRDHAVECLSHLGRGAEGVERATRWAAERPDADAQQILARAHLFRGDFEEAVSATERAVELGGGWKAQALRAEALSLVGRYAEAEAVARRLAALEGPPEARQSGAMNLALVLTSQGRRREARAELDRMRAEGEGMVKGSGHRAAWLLGEGRGAAAEIEREAENLSGPQGARKAASLAAALALLGEVERARALARRTGAEKDEGLVAVLRWREGDREGAVAALRALEARGSAGASYLLGELLAEARRDREAVEAFRSFQGRHLDPWLRAWAGPRSLLLAATSLERLGDRAGARAEVDRLLALWRRADADQPGLAEARALRARLAR